MSLNFEKSGLQTFPTKVWNTSSMWSLNAASNPEQPTNNLDNQVRGSQSNKGKKGGSWTGSWTYNHHMEGGSRSGLGYASGRSQRTPSWSIEDLGSWGTKYPTTSWPLAKKLASCLHFEEHHLWLGQCDFQSRSMAWRLFTFLREGLCFSAAPLASVAMVSMNALQFQPPTVEGPSKSSSLAVPSLSVMTLTQLAFPSSVSSSTGSTASSSASSLIGLHTGWQACWWAVLASPENNWVGGPALKIFTAPTRAWKLLPG